MPSHLFAVANLLALTGWLLLAAFPRRRWASLATRALIPAAFAAAYLLIIATRWGHSPGGFSSLAAVAQLFADPWLLLAGWLHYLAFDLLVGNWIVRDAHARGISHPWLLPVLLLTFLFGPTGWLAYLALRAAQAPRSTPREPAPSTT